MKTKSLYRQLPVLLALALLLGGSGCSKQAKRTRYLTQADQNFKAERYETAEVEYLKVLQISPLDPSAIRQLGFIYYEQGRLPQAYAYLQKAAELDPDNIDIRLKLGLAYMSVHKYKEAAAEAGRVLEKHPGQEDALLLLATAAATQQEIQATVVRIKQLQKQDQAKPGYHLALGTLYFRQKDSAAAESEFGKALTLDPKSGSAQLALGSIYWARNDRKQAETAFQRAAELSPLRSVKRLKYAEFKLQTGAVAEARQLLEDINRQAPDYLPAWTYLIQVAFTERKYEECTTLVQKLLARDSQNFDGLFMRGRLKLVQGEAANAVSEFTRMNTIYERVPQVQYQLAVAHLMNNDASKALSCLNQAVALNPNYPEALLLQAELNIRSGNPTPAVNTLTQLVRQNPQIPQAHLLLANAYLAQKNPDEAVAVYGRMMATHTNNFEVPTLIGIILVQENKKEAARRAFEQSLELSPNYLPAIEQLVDLDLRDRQYDAASARVQKLLAQTPVSAMPQLLMAKISLAQTNLLQAETNLLQAIEFSPELRTPYLLLAQLYVTSGKHQQALERLNSLVARTNDAPALMQIGMIHDELKDPPAARDAYEKLLGINPKFSPALNNLAYLYSEKLGQIEKAYALALRARQLLPYDPYTADTLGWVLFKRGEYSRALGLLQESAGKLSREMEVLFHLGMAQYMTGDEEAARRTLQGVVESGKHLPGQEEARRRLAVIAINPLTANATEIANLEQGLQATPNDPIALNRLGAIYEREGNFDKSLQAYEAALKQDQKNPRLRLKLAQLYSGKLNNPAKAADLIKATHELAPEDPDVSHALGRLNFQTGDFSHALSLLQIAALKLPEQPELLYDLAWAYYSVGQVKDAEANMRAAVKIGGLAKAAEAGQFLRFVEAANNPAQLQSLATATSQILSSNTNFAPALMTAALMQEQQGNNQAAIQLYDKILSLYPLFIPATRQLAMIYADKLGNDKAAYGLALKAREADPDDVELAKTLGMLVYRRGDFPRAAQLLQESARKRNADAELMYFLGMAQYRAKNQAGSKVSLQRALDLNLTGAPAAEAKKLLAELK